MRRWGSGPLAAGERACCCRGAALVCRAAGIQSVGAGGRESAADQGADHHRKEAAVAAVRKRAARGQRGPVRADLIGSGQQFAMLWR